MQIEATKSVTVPATADRPGGHVSPESLAGPVERRIAVPGLAVPNAGATGAGRVGANGPSCDVVGALRRRSASSPPIVRRLFSDSTLSIVGIRARLAAAYPTETAKFTYAKVAPLLADVATTYTWEQLVAKLGLTTTGHDAELAADVPQAVTPVPETTPTGKGTPGPVQTQRPGPSSAPLVSGGKTVTAPQQAKPAVAETSRPVSVAKSGTVDAVELGTRVREVFAAAKKPNAPTRDEIMAMITAHYSSEVVESAEFAYAYQDAVRSMISPTGKDKGFLEKSAITDVEDTSIDVSKYKMGDMNKWKLRHYTTAGTDTDPPPFKQIKSAMAVSMLSPGGSKDAAAADAASPSADVPGKAETASKVDTRKSGHTGDRDWNRYGNTANTFYVLVLDGVLPEKQKFLENTKWYAEISFDQPSLWISSDWLDEASIKPGAFRGSGKAVQKHLLKLGGNVPGDLFRKALMNHFNNLEVKIPGTVDVESWHKA